jgi:nucleotide-binding universal stress UspA family protein
MVMWATGWDFRTALQETYNALHGFAATHGGSLPPPRVELPDPEEDRRRLEKLKRTYDRSLPLDHPRARIARRYLEKRGIVGDYQLPKALRFISNIPYYTESDKKPGTYIKMGEYPALLAVVTNSAGKAITLHRIYLTVDGDRAPVKDTKKSMLSPSDRKQSGIMVRLGQPAKILHIAEGIETALAVTLITGQACWATISAVHVANFDPPPGVEAVCIWADKDRSGTGEAAAIALRDRLRRAGLRAVIAKPPYDIEPGEKSFDWLDAVKNYGIDAIRSSNFFVHHLGRVLSAVESQIDHEKKQHSI